MKYRVALAVIVVTTLGLCLSGDTAKALVAEGHYGTWPKDWPRELDQYREHAWSWAVRTETEENAHQIEFEKREDFERAWQHILRVKGDGAPLIIERGPSRYIMAGSETTIRGGVRILEGSATTPDGNPWPDSIRIPSGGLPDYATRVFTTPDLSEWHWDAYDPKSTQTEGGRVRVRTDIVLVVDGKIVDMNRIPLPANTVIIDKRFDLNEEKAG